MGSGAHQVEAALGVTDAAGEDLVSVVIVSFNTVDLLGRCLEELTTGASVPLQVIVVDNASTDGSPEMVRRRFPEVEMIGLESNAGFGAANNLAFAQCRGTHVLLLNSDAFIGPSALSALLEVAHGRPDAAVVGPKLNGDGTLQRSAWPFRAPGAWCSRPLVRIVYFARPGSSKSSEPGPTTRSAKSSSS